MASHYAKKFEDLYEVFNKRVGGGAGRIAATMARPIKIVNNLFFILFSSFTFEIKCTSI